MIRGVTVDWWHTMVEPHGDDWEQVAKRLRCEAIERVLKAHGITCTFERIDLAYDLWTDHLKRAWKKNVDWSSERQVSDLLASAGYDGRADASLLKDMREPIGAPLVEHLPKLHEGVLEVLGAMRERGLKLAVISNTGRTWGQFLRQVQDRLGLSGWFDHLTFSDEARTRKPSRAIFEGTLAALELRPEEVVHVGDDVDADVAGAKAAGMRAVWYDTGRWTGASTDQADAVIHAWTQLPDLLRRW
jgi:putative hydrolase of the HAD superfamily